jgi:hypothetical protein
MPTIDSLGDEFLEAARTGSFITIDNSGRVTVE